MVSKNTKEEKAIELQQILGVKQDHSIGHYLGMPSQNKKSKRVLFNRLKVRVEKVLQSWKESLFSTGGKKVLIKAIAQAIPTYTMYCFRIPKGLCDDINKACARFWCGASKDRRKIHWLNWKKMCKSKELGGMGFRDICLFNQAMLAKQSWQIIRNPDSLLASPKGEIF